MKHSFSYSGRIFMKEITLQLEPAVVLFYTRLACSLGVSLEQVLADALFKLAGELSLEALRQRAQ
jgi:hypothetical protein